MEKLTGALASNVWAIPSPSSQHWIRTVVDRLTSVVFASSTASSANDGLDHEHRRTLLKDFDIGHTGIGRVLYRQLNANSKLDADSQHK
jgi:hypothetical protein